MDNSNIQLHTFCCNVAYLRLSYGKTKKEMAAIMGVSVKTLNAIEGGVVPKRFRSRSLLQLCSAFQLLPSKLFEERLDGSAVETDL